MTKSRLLALSDGVIAIIMTIMVLELKTPVTGGWSGLFAAKFVLLSYVVSFIAVYYFWTVHDELFKALGTLPINTVWVNAVYLLTLSLLPFTTSWVGRFLQGRPAELTYSFNFLLITLAAWWLEYTIRKDFRQRGQAVPAGLAHSMRNLLKTAVVNAGGCILVFIWPPLGLLTVFIMLTVWISASVRSARRSRPAQ